MFFPPLKKDSSHKVLRQFSTTYFAVRNSLPDCQLLQIVPQNKTNETSTSINHFEMEINFYEYIYIYEHKEKIIKTEVCKIKHKKEKKQTKQQFSVSFTCYKCWHSSNFSSTFLAVWY